jgi:hypothetical protein
MTAAWSRGWDARVELGPGQERMRQQLLAIAKRARHPSRMWAETTMREHDRSSSTAHRLIHRLHALGVIAIQPTLGSSGGTRFTFGVRFWHRQPVRRGMLARFRPPADGQASLELLPEPEERPPGRIVEEPEREPIPHPHPYPPAGETFAEKMRRHGLDESKLFGRESDAKLPYGRGR